jgi:DNA helicase-2/ATP-dependent DNA helicase PcrA
LDFPKLYSPCQVIRLERNYRSTSSILEVANQVIAKNKQRHGKILRPESRHGAGNLPELFVFDNEEEEADFVGREILQAKQAGKSPSDVAVLYRSNSQGGMIESQLRQHQIPYTVSGSTAFFDRKEIKDVLAFLRFSLQPNDVSLRRMINTPPRGIGDTSIEKLNAYGDFGGFTGKAAGGSASRSGIAHVFAGNRLS